MEKKITSTQIIENSNIPPTIVRAVIRRVGADTIAECTQADAGWPGFCYHRETVGFFNAHRADILQMIRDLARDCGEEPARMIEGFGCVKDGADEDTRAAIYRLLSGSPARFSKPDEVTIGNALAWYALEEVANDANDM